MDRNWKGCGDNGREYRRERDRSAAAGEAHRKKQAAQSIPRSPHKTDKAEGTVLQRTIKWGNVSEGSISTAWGSSAPEGKDDTFASGQGKPTDVLYEIEYKSRNVWFYDLRADPTKADGCIVATTKLDTENDLVFSFLVERQDIRITREQLQKAPNALGGRKLKKTFHKIVENLGFHRDLRAAFFEVRGDDILFRSKVTRADLDAKGIKNLPCQCKDRKKSGHRRRSLRPAAITFTY